MNSFDDYRILLGRRIREKREALGISQRKFALMVDVHRNYMGDIEAGRANPSLDILLKIAEGLEVDVWELMRLR